MNANAEDKLETIYIAMNNKYFGRRYSEEIVGGRTRLFRLIGEGEIRADKPNKCQNGKWRCNAADVLRNASIEWKLKMKKQINRSDA